MRFFQSWFRGNPRKKAKQKFFPNRRPSIRPRVETLEDRVVPAVNDFYVVPGAAGEQVAVHFEWNIREAAFNNSLAVYVVNDQQGSVLGAEPGDPDYARMVSSLAQEVFQSGDGAGAARTILFPAGTILGFVLVTNAPLQSWQTARQTVAANVYGTNVAWLSFNGSNPEPGFDAVFSRDLGVGVKQFFFEDLGAGGDLSFTDRVFTVSPTGDRAFAIPGLTGQQTPTTFELLGRNSALSGQLGLFFVDNALGQIGSMFPADDGYLEQALAANRGEVIFSPLDPAGTVNVINLPSNGFFAFYYVAGGTAAEVLANNPGNIPGTGFPQAFFFFPEQNFDKFNHFRVLGPNTFGVEDQFGGGDQDFEDLIFRFNFGTAEGDVFPPQITAALQNDNGNNTSDGITSDPTVVGTVTDQSTIVEFLASIDNATPSFNVLPDLQNGQFLFDRARLEQIAGATLTDGQHTLRLRARDEAGNISQIFPLTFTLDTSISPATQVNLDPNFDSGEQGDLETFFDPVTLVGTTEANSDVLLTLPDTSTRNTTSDASGNFSFTAIPLVLGANIFTVEVTDQFGNQLQTPFTITRVNNSAPVFNNTIADITMQSTDAARVVELATFFTDPDTGNSLVRFNVQFGDQTGIIDIELFDRDAPATVANFLNYIESNRYSDSIFHRLDDNFVLQGGGFTFDPAPQFVAVDTDPIVVNEPGISNTEGTIAMAKGSQVNSATSQFFINLNNNTGLDDPNNAGGFTVFGEVVAGMDLIDQLNDNAANLVKNFSVGDAAPPALFSELPVFGDVDENTEIAEDPAGSGQFPLPAGTQESNFAAVDNVNIIRTIDRLTYTIEIISESSVGFVNSVVTINNRLIIDPNKGGTPQTGTATIQIRATDSAGNFVLSNQFTITIT